MKKKKKKKNKRCFLPFKGIFFKTTVNFFLPSNRIKYRGLSMLNLFKNFNFMKLFLGRFITNIGDSIYYVAAMWLVYELGGSAFYSGLAGFLILIPNAFQFLFGPIVDKHSVKSILVISQVIQAILVSIIPILYYYELLSVTLILIIMPIISIVNQFAYPASQAIIPKVIPRDHLVKGNSLMSIAYQGVDMAFNAISGILIGLVGIIYLYMIDTMTFIICSILFFLIKIPKDEKSEVSEESSEIKERVKLYFKELKEGIRFCFDTIVSKFFIQNIIANFVLGAMMAILPAYADLRGGPEVYGLLLGVFSAGILTGSFLAPFLEKVKLGYLLSVSFFIGSIMWTSSALIGNNVLSIAIFGLASVPIGITNVVLFSTLQNIIPEKLMGRVLSVIMSIGSCSMPIGSLLGGILSPIIGIKLLMALCGSGFLIVSIYILVNSEVRRLPSSKNLKPTNFRISV